MFWLAIRIQGNLGQTPGQKYCSKALNGSHIAEHPSYTFSALPCRTNYSQIWTRQNRQNAEHTCDCPCDNGCAAPIIFAHKKGNDVTVRNLYPLLRMDENIDLFVIAEVFSTIDANWRFWKIGAKKERGNKAAFTLHHGLYCFICMTFRQKRPL